MLSIMDVSLQGYMEYKNLLAQEHRVVVDSSSTCLPDLSGLDPLEKA